MPELQVLIPQSATDEASVVPIAVEPATASAADIDALRAVSSELQQRLTSRRAATLVRDSQRFAVGRPDLCSAILAPGSPPKSALVKNLEAQRAGVLQLLGRRSTAEALLGVQINRWDQRLHEMARAEAAGDAKAAAEAGGGPPTSLASVYALIATRVQQQAQRRFALGEAVANEADTLRPAVLALAERVGKGNA
jgi:hypothetical protein